MWAFAYPALLLLLALAAFGPALPGPFAFDDEASVVGNPSLDRLWPLSRPLEPPPGGSPVSGRPVSNLTLALDAALNRSLGVADASSPNAPIAFRATNLLIHVAVALLLFALVRDTMRAGRISENWRERSDIVAAIVAAVWLVHPLQTDAIDYVSQRTELVVSLCYLGVLYASTRSWFIAAVAISIVGMASKEVMITAPVAVLLYDAAFRPEGWRGRGKFYASLIATGAVCLWLVARRSRGESVSFTGAMTWTQYARSQAWAVAHYLRLAVWPNDLRFDYGDRPVGGAWVWPSGLLLLALAGATLWAWTKATTRWLGFAGAWFFLLLAPSSSVVPIQTEVAAERRVYLALAGVVAAVVVGALALADRPAERDPRRPRQIANTCSGILILVLTIAAARRSALYRDPERLWADAIHKQPTNARAWDNLAAAKIRENPPALAAADTLLHHAIAADPTYVRAWTRLAGIAVHDDRLDSALTLLRHALTLAPRDSDAINRIGRVFLARGQPDSAARYLALVAARAPAAATLRDLGVAYLEVGRADSAAPTLRRAVDLDPTHLAAASYLGAALMETNQGAAAVSTLERVVQTERNPTFDIAVLSVAYAEAGRATDAIAAARLATQRAPNEGAVFGMAGRAMIVARRFDDAERYLDAATRLSPGDAQALTRLAVARAAQGNRAGASAAIARALTVAPHYAFAIATRDSLGLSR